MANQGKFKVAPQELFDYATNYAKRHVAAGNTGCYPTISAVMRKFKVTSEQIETAIEDYVGTGYLGLIVAIGCSGGIAEIEVLNERRVEAY